VSDLSSALLITVAGMGLVFVTIVLFWGVMALMVRLITGRQDEPAVEAEAGPGDDSTAAGLEMQRRAALAAVAVALALEAEEKPRPFPLPPPVLVNTWQSVMRARHLARRGDIR